MDDPFTFGKIAATNAISDIYAMGASPLTAMNLAFFPECSLPMSVLKDILRGGQDVLEDAGVCLVGGHTVQDSELKYGLAVTGTVTPDRIIRNSTARPGDILILTKPLGTGILSTAIKGEMASDSSLQEAVKWMTTLNREASTLMIECNAHAATDITGFGLIGHAVEMARGAGVTYVLEQASIPHMREIPELVADGMVPAGCYRNRDYFMPYVAHSSPGDTALLPLLDPQTSGGLLIALSPPDATVFICRAKELDLFCSVIGHASLYSNYFISLQ